MSTTDVLIFFVSVFILLYYLLVKRPKNFPPGPVGWPFVGSLFQLNSQRHTQFVEWSRKYGSDIIGFYVGPTPTVVLNNYKHIKEAFAEHNFAGRNITRLLYDRNFGGNRGLLFSEGETWIAQRRFCLKNLRDFGFGKKTMEGTVMDEVNELIATFRKEVGHPISTQNRFNLSVLNALWTILAGQRFALDDPMLNQLIKALTTVITKRPLTSVLSEHIPLVYKLRKAFPSLFNRSGKAFQDNTYKMIGSIVKQHKETLQEDSPRDFIDCYLIESNKTMDVHSSFYKEEGELGLFVNLLDLFIAGAETTSTTLTWAFLILALNPDEQEKMYQEIKSVVGTSRSVSLSDRPNLLRLDATIMEIMRLSSIVALGVSHKTMEEIQFHGYTIPKGTTIIPNLYNALRNGKAWKNPEEFLPDRFLSADGFSLIRNDAWIPFSAGRRVCLGESLAKDELFLFMGNLFQQFKVMTVEGDKPTLEGHASAVLIPKPHQLIVLDRHATAASQ